MKLLRNAGAFSHLLTSSLIVRGRLCNGGPKRHRGIYGICPVQRNRIDGIRPALVTTWNVSILSIRNGYRAWYRNCQSDSMDDGSVISYLNELADLNTRTHAALCKRSSDSQSRRAPHYLYTSWHRTSSNPNKFLSDQGRWCV